MKRFENSAAGILLLIAGGLVLLLAVGFMVFVCAFLIIGGGVGMVVGIAGLVGLALALASGIRDWVRKHENDREGHA
jgi:membrane protein implicated in regulation of membrane protease activity